MPLFEGEKDLGSVIFVVLLSCSILSSMKTVRLFLILLNFQGPRTPVDLVIICSSAIRSVGIRGLVRDEVSEFNQSLL